MKTLTKLYIAIGVCLVILACVVPRVVMSLTADSYHAKLEELVVLHDGLLSAEELDKDVERSAQEMGVSKEQMADITINAMRNALPQEYKDSTSVMAMGVKYADEAITAVAGVVLAFLIFALLRKRKASNTVHEGSGDEASSSQTQTAREAYKRAFPRRY